MVDEELNERVTRLERQMTVIQKDVKDTRTLVAAIDVDVADIKRTQRGHTGVINAVSANQVALREDFEALRVEMKQGFAEVGRQFALVDRQFGLIDRKFALVDVNFATVETHFTKVRGDLGRIIELLEPAPQT